MWKARIQNYLFVILIFLLLPGCASKSRVDKSELNQQEATDRAVEIASISMPEISGSQVAPSNIHAEKMTLEEAAKRFGTNPQNTFSKVALETQVWLVSMDGIWLPASAPGVVQKPYEHLWIVIDVKTGQEIYRNMQP